MRALATLTLLLIAASPALAQPNPASQELSAEARAHLEKGLEHHGAREYEAALGEFRAGYEVEPSPVFLFAMAQAERLSGDCRSAAVYYREFLDTNPSAMHAETARDLLDRCERALASHPVPPELPIAGSAPPPATKPPPVALALQPQAQSRSDRQHWYEDKLGMGLLGAGVASATVGVAYYVVARSAESSSLDAATYAEFDDAARRAHRNQSIALVGLGAGAALLTVYAIRQWRRSTATRRGAGLSAAVGPNSVQAGLAVEF